MLLESFQELETTFWCDAWREPCQDRRQPRALPPFPSTNANDLCESNRVSNKREQGKGRTFGDGVERALHDSIAHVVQQTCQIGFGAQHHLVAQRVALSSVVECVAYRLGRHLLQTYFKHTCFTRSACNRFYLVYKNFLFQQIEKKKTEIKTHFIITQWIFWYFPQCIES